MNSGRLLEDPAGIQALFHRLMAANEKVTVAHRQNRRPFLLVHLEAEHLALAMDRGEFEGWQLKAGEKVSLNLEDRGFTYEAVALCEGHSTAEDLPCLQVGLPRSLRRTDLHRLVDFAPDAEVACTFTNARSALLDGVVKGLGREGVELALRDPRQRIGDFFRMGEESTLDLPLEGNLRLMAPTKVAYLDEQKVGLRFTERTDGALLGQYRTWLDGQQRLQAQRDREAMLEGGGGRTPLRRLAPERPTARLWVDRDPLILVLTEQDEFVQRMAEALGRKFGFLALDHISGPVRPQVQAWAGCEGPGWGRLRLILVHHRLRLASPLELTRQLAMEEHCPLPLLVAGAEEDLDLKRLRAVEAGAVDFLAVEPFRILRVLQQLDQTLKVFA